MRCIPTILIAFGLLLALPLFAAAQGFGVQGIGGQGIGGQGTGGFGLSLPSDVLKPQVEIPSAEGYAVEQSVPEVHLLLGRQRPRRQFMLRAFAGYLDRNRLRRIYALSQYSHARRAVRRHRRKH